MALHASSLSFSAPPKSVCSLHPIRRPPSSSSKAFISYSHPLTQRSSATPRRAVAVSAQYSGEHKSNGRRIWRRRTLKKKDEQVEYSMQRVLFLEEQVRKIRESGEVISMDIHKLLLSEENKFDFINEIAAEATSYVEDNPGEYGATAKKPLLHVLSNRINEAGFYRPDAYLEEDPFFPNTDFVREMKI